MNKFEETNRALMPQIRSVLKEWFPAGKELSGEYCIGDLSGKAGNSLKINLSTGKWCDFATNDKGGDLVSLYASAQEMEQGAAADILSEKYSINIKQQQSPSNVNKFQTFPSPSVKTRPSFPDGSIVYEYKDHDGHILFYVARFMKSGKKIFRPYTYFTSGASDDRDKGEWKPQGIRTTSSIKRPLFGLEYLTEANKDKPVLIVEGEKAVLAARQFVEGKCIVMTWCGGSNSVKKAEWNPILGRKILIWPDADKAGGDAADQIVEELFHGATEIKVINVRDIERKSKEESSKFKKGWDAADSGFKTSKEFFDWARPRIEKIDLESEESPEDQKAKKEEAQALRNKQKELRLLMNQNGKLMCNEAQAIRILENHREFDGKIFFDEFKRKFYFDKDELEDHILTKILSFIQEDLKIEKISTGIVKRSFEYVAMNNKRNTRREWLESLKWDGSPRIDESMVVYFNAEASGGKDHYKYLQSAGRNFWISLAARGMKPGCKVDFMLILEGRQGTEKSEALKVIGGDGYTQPVCSINKEEAFMSSIEGSSLVEIAEMDSFRGADVTRMKKILSTATDNIKKLYKDPKEYPRTFIFAGTTNEQEYLRDDTGNRRFIPVEVGDTKMDALKRDLDQLYAEAVHRYKAGDSWWEFPSYAEVIQRQKVETDLWQPFVEDYLNSPGVKDKGFVTLQELFQFAPAEGQRSGAIPTSKDYLDKGKKDRMSSILKHLGWQRKEEWSSEKKRSEKRYRPSTR